MGSLNRSSFLGLAGAGTAATVIAPKLHALSWAEQEAAKAVAANDHIQIALIGAGGQGMGDTRTALQVP